MSERGTGETTRQILSAIDEVLAGSNVLFVCGSQQAVRYSMDLTQAIAPDMPLEFHPQRHRILFGQHWLRFLRAAPFPGSATAGLDCVVRFDHAWWWRLQSDLIAEWEAVAEGHNRRYSVPAGGA